MNDEQWWTGTTQCSICQHTQTIVIPIGPDETEPIVPIECANCGNMTCSPDE